MALGRLLVVGGTGFIGRHICCAALKLGYAVTSLSLQTTSTQISGIEYLYADCSDPGALSTALARKPFDFVVNCGGYIDHRLFRDGGERILKTHFDAVVALTSALDRQSLKRFVQVGSSDEYGTAPAPQVESERESPISPYSLAKVAATHFLQMLWRTERFPAVTMRLFLTYGPGQATSRFLPQVVCGCLTNSVFPVSEGSQLRDFCHVSDVVRGILQSLGAKDVCGTVINLASGVPQSVRSVVDQVRVIAGGGHPHYGQIPFRADENMALFADILKAEALLSWKPEIMLADGLQDTINFYREQIHEC